MIIDPTIILYALLSVGVVSALLLAMTKFSHTPTKDCNDCERTKYACNGCGKSHYK